MSNSLRICLASAAYHPYPSGVTEYVHNLAAALRVQGHRVEVLTTGYDRFARRHPKLPCPELPGVTRFGQALLVPLNRSYATVPLGSHMSDQVRRYLADREFDVVHLNGIFPPDISFWALKHSRSVNVITFHTVAFATSPLAARLCRALFGRYNRRVHGRIAVSQGALGFIRPYFPGEYRVIREGVDLDRFGKPGTAPSESVPGSPNRILFLGRLEPRKGLAVLLNALPKVRRAVPDVRLEVVGNGPLAAEARALANRLGIERNIRFRGYLPGNELPACYAGCDVFCAPTLGGEAFGIVLLEAMAGGATVVASDITGYKEVVQHGTSGLLVPPGDSTALARTLVSVLADPEQRARLRAGGLARAEYHSWSRVASDIEDYYRELLNRNQRSGS